MAYLLSCGSPPLRLLGFKSQTHTNYYRGSTFFTLALKVHFWILILKTVLVELLHRSIQHKTVCRGDQNDTDGGMALLLKNLYSEKPHCSPLHVQALYCYFICELSFEGILWSFVEHVLPKGSRAVEMFRWKEIHDNSSVFGRGLLQIASLPECSCCDLLDWDISVIECGKTRTWGTSAVNIFRICMFVVLARIGILRSMHLKKTTPRNERFENWNRANRDIESCFPLKMFSERSSDMEL